MMVNPNVCEICGNLLKDGEEDICDVCFLAELYKSFGLDGDDEINVKKL